MSQPRITAKIIFLPQSDAGRTSLPANLSSGQYRPHLVVGDLNQLRAVVMNRVLGETYLGVTFVRGPEEIIAGESFQTELVLMYWPNIKYEALVPGARFAIREGPHTVGYGTVESVSTNDAT